MARGRKTGGRQKGTPNKREQDGAAEAMRLITDATYLERLKVRLLEGTCPHLETLLWNMAYGKPVERKVITGDTDEPLVVRLIQYTDDA
jgi:hypothetical protein